MSGQMTAPCATAACPQPATKLVAGWPMCWEHAAPKSLTRGAGWDAFLLLRTWIGRLHHAGLVDTDIAGVTGVSPSTVRMHRRRLDLPGHRTAAQLTRDDRRLTAADRRISRCACTAWRWDGTCTRCPQSVVA